MQTNPVLWDGVDRDRLVAAAERWRPATGDPSKGRAFAEGRQRLAAALAATTTPSARAEVEAEAVEWLYRLLRANVKRGRRFDLAEVLESGGRQESLARGAGWRPLATADCLGYAKLFVALARVVGLDAGVADVVIDNAGRYVPHTVALVCLADGRRRFVDPWYGSADIRHRRLGLEVLEGGEWTARDADWERLDSFDGVRVDKSRLWRPLPDVAATAITLYVRANRLLKADPPEAAAAIALYSEAIRLYPHNTRAHFNRAIAYDSLGRAAEVEDSTRRAAADYARALGDESSLIRVLATEHDDVVALLRLDEAAVPEAAQAVYLRAAGFVSGEPMALDAVAAALGLSVAAARDAMEMAMEAVEVVGE